MPWWHAATRATAFASSGPPVASRGRWWPKPATASISCPGGDFCSLANAKSIPVAEAIQRRFDDLDYLHDIGELDLNISGCINACGHHHVGHIGILGLDKKGEEFYQITLGGSPAEDASIGTILGPGFAGHEVADAVGKILDTYLALRQPGEALSSFCRSFRTKTSTERSPASIS